MILYRYPAVLVLIILMLAGCGASPADRPDRMQILAFTDTSRVRIEATFDSQFNPAAEPVKAVIRARDDGSVLWSGALGQPEKKEDGTYQLIRNVEGLLPQRWSPSTPNLYDLVVDAGGAYRDSVRFGFRSVETREGRILVNGLPIFLRGNAINPPERMVPDSLHENRRFVEDYVRYLKSKGVNIIRMTRHSQIWFDVCDELGMMIYQGHYGTPRGARATKASDLPFEELIQWYRDDVIEPLVNHPSVIIYVLSNEQASVDIPYLNRGADEVEQYLTQVYHELSQWDATRLYIGNAGYGFGRSGDICDIHRYWGWYYNSFLSYYTLREPRNYWRSNKIQPITLTEAVGNYTGVDGGYNLVPGTKQPDSQLNWTGHAPKSEQSERALKHQAFVAKQAIEISRRIRDRNPYLSGLMPFTILFHNWADISRFSDMNPKPVLEQYKVSYQPVLLSWELWTGQVYAGSTIRPVVHIVNDSEDGADISDLELYVTLKDDAGVVRFESRVAMPDVPYYGVAEKTLSIPLPGSLATGTYTLEGRLSSGGRVLSHNEHPVFVAGRGFAGNVADAGREVVVYDPRGDTRRALTRLQIPFSTVSDLSGLNAQRHTLIIGARAWDERLSKQPETLRTFIASGGRVLCLEQDPDRFDTSWLAPGVKLQTAELDHELVYPGGRPFRNGLSVNPERPDHPVFEGIDRDRLYMWSDYSRWDESKPGFPEVYPVVQGYTLTSREDLARTAVLANYDHGLEGIALSEMFEGKGSALLSGFGIVDRVGLDPIADRMFVNMVSYMASSEAHHAQPEITSKIVWGDYESERGLVTGIYSGLLLHSVPVVPEGLEKKYPLRVTEEGHHLAGAGGGWNTRPSIQYVPSGRRPFGPYSFSLGGMPRRVDKDSQIGEGRFWCRIPSDRTRMVTSVWNPIDEPLELEIVVNGIRQQVRIGGGKTEQVETPLRNSDDTLSVTFRGDFRLVLMETDFH